MKVLVTGCFGFIGFNYLNYIYKNFNEEFQIVGIDSLESSCSKKNRYLSPELKNFEIFEDTILNIHNLNIDNIDIIINFAAETHVDNSIFRPEKFVESNILGLTHLLKFAIEKDVDNFIHISTDEIYGSTKDSFFKEEDNIKASSPYSASKASAELICKSFTKTYGLNINMLRPGNNYGIYQQPEKLIPFSIANLLSDKNIELYGNGENVRHWLFVDDTSSAVMKIIEASPQNEIYNIGSGYYLSNLELAKKLLQQLNLDEDRLEFVEDRPGHDFRYATDFSKLESIGWSPLANFDKELTKIVDWYKNNEDWWREEYNYIVRKTRSRRLDIK
tara:strand:+ start:1656 stop:2651 length:996 start_codon:yes stop_codon:yes gene_type:complete